MIAQRTPTLTVGVWHLRPFASYASCRCGWRGRRRWFVGLASVDAHMHSSDTAHMPCWPLVVRTTPRSPWWPWAVLAVLALVLAVLWAPTARADDTDDLFLGAISSAGIDATADAILAARVVCSEMDRGFSADEMAYVLADVTDLTLHQAGVFVGTAIAAYCPQHNVAPVLV